MLAWAGCDSGGAGYEPAPDQEPVSNQAPVPDQIAYELSAQTSDGIGGTVAFWRAGPDSSLVTLNLDGDATLPGVSHPAHIHKNSVSDGRSVLRSQDASSRFRSDRRLSVTARRGCSVIW